MHLHALLDRLAAVGPTDRPCISLFVDTVPTIPGVPAWARSCARSSASVRMPHLYPLARLLEQWRGYAVVVTDTHLARIYVAALGSIAPRATVERDKVSRSDEDARD